jgi:acyl-coenzyme A thioesterase PaaI-like protein
MKIFETARHENLIGKTRRIFVNFFPCYRRGGGRIIFFSSDMQEIHVKVALNWQTRNYVGSVFGGALYSAIDPIYMLQLIWILGKDYVIWDKSASIKFIRPVKSTVYAKFELSDELISNIKAEVANNGRYLIHLPVTLQDKNGTVYCTASKELYIANKEHHQKRQEQKNTPGK